MIGFDPSPSVMDRESNGRRSIQAMDLNFFVCFARGFKMLEILVPRNYFHFM